MIMNEDKINRDDADEKMSQRYANVKKELDNQHTLERIKLEKLFGKQMLASLTVFSYRNNKDQFKSTKGFQISPNKQMTSANMSAGPAS